MGSHFTKIFENFLQKIGTSVFANKIDNFPLLALSFPPLLGFLFASFLAKPSHPFMYLLSKPFKYFSTSIRIQFRTSNNSIHYPISITPTLSLSSDRLPPSLAGSVQAIVVGESCPLRLASFLSSLRLPPFTPLKSQPTR